MNISDEAVEAAAKAIYDRFPSPGQRSGSTDDVLSWEKANELRKALDYSDAKAALAAAAPHLISQIAADILEGMRAWAGDKELGFLEGYADASDDVVLRSAGAGE